MKIRRKDRMERREINWIKKIKGNREREEEESGREE